MAGRKNHGVGGVRGDPHRGFLQAPSVLISGLHKSLQQEWAFVQRVTPGIRGALGPVEKELRETFVPALFEGLGEVSPDRGVTVLPVK